MVPWRRQQQQQQRKGKNIAPQLVAVVRVSFTLQCCAHRGIWSSHKFESNFVRRHTNDKLWSNALGYTDDGCPRPLSVKLGSSPRLVCLGVYMLLSKVPNERVLIMIRNLTSYGR